MSNHDESKHPKIQSIEPVIILKDKRRISLKDFVNQTERNTRKQKITRDLHNYELGEAKEVIWDDIADCMDRNIKTLEVIHGYHKGQVLQKYFRSEEFIKENKHVGLTIKRQTLREDGKTVFKVIYKP